MPAEIDYRQADAFLRFISLSNTPPLLKAIFFVITIGWLATRNFTRHIAEATDTPPLIRHFRAGQYFSRWYAIASFEGWCRFGWLHDTIFDTSAASPNRLRVWEPIYHLSADAEDGRRGRRRTLLQPTLSATTEGLPPTGCQYAEMLHEMITEELLRLPKLASFLLRRYAISLANSQPKDADAR